jgi:hypothetical protein
MKIVSRLIISEGRASTVGRVLYKRGGWKGLTESDACAGTSAIVLLDFQFN